jgi:hypothetical protein
MSLDLTVAISSNSIVKEAKPVVLYLKNFLETVLGKASSFKFNLQHVLLIVVVFVLMEIANELAEANALQQKQLKLLRQQQAKQQHDETSKKNK